MSYPDDIRRGTLKAAWSDPTADRGERFDELAQDMDAWKKASAVQHARIETALGQLHPFHASTKRAYRSALDCTDEPASTDALSLLIDQAQDKLREAVSLAVVAGDQRRDAILDALTALREPKP